MRATSVLALLAAGAVSVGYTTASGPLTPGHPDSPLLERQPDSIPHRGFVRRLRKVAHQAERGFLGVDESGASSAPELQRRQGGSYSGRATYYDVGLGACGSYSSSNEYVVALNTAQYGNTGQRSSWCFQTISITYQGQTRQATVVDACPTCGPGDLDMSRSLFQSFTNLGTGQFQMSWSGGGGGQQQQQAEQARSSSSSSTWSPPTSSWSSSSSQYTPSSSSYSSSSYSSSSSSSSTQSSSSSSSTSSSSSSTSSTSTSTSTSSSAQTTSGVEALNNFGNLNAAIDGMIQMAQDGHSQASSMAAASASSASMAAATSPTPAPGAAPSSSNSGSASRTASASQSSVSDASSSSASSSALSSSASASASSSASPSAASSGSSADTDPASASASTSS